MQLVGGDDRVLLSILHILHGLTMPQTHFTAQEEGEIGAHTHDIGAFAEKMDSILELVVRTRTLRTVVDAMNVRMFAAVIPSSISPGSISTLAVCFAR